ncbi:NAD(P)H-hydrate dehydratase [Intrasporangium calvum]|uniref:NAD(P)H-hydrate dehydratase n=1 Tax=Intrasporangium calvum TaxID=53358 RepID=UPI000DF63712|nr:NAD(P)H-hydrate dehydratase [Intrasporangium calvum]AXG13301.1 NAD(P)H-hydrate dehydratase [Intrasporangium calvum]
MPETPPTEPAGTRDPAAGSGADLTITPGLLRGWALPDPGGDKYAKGRVLIVGGGVQTPGAVLLAAEAALRVGAGQLQMATVRSTAPLLSTAVPEAYVEGLPEERDGDISPDAAARVLELAASADAVLLGPGIMAPDAARALLERVVPHLECSVVLDALGMAYLTAHRDGVRHLEGRVLLTPNARELAETLGEEHDDPADDVLRAMAGRLAAQSRAVVLGGAATSFVVTPDGEVWRNESGAPGMAASGAGDAKAGAIAGLLARGAGPAQAAAWGAFIHGRAGERLTAAIGRVGFLARELVRELPTALAEIEV